MPSDLPSQTPAPNAETPDGENGGIDIDLSKITALVIEDEEAISAVICALLEKIGVGETIAVRTSEDALGFLEDEDAKVKIALVDLLLPGASGLALIKTLREHKKERLRTMPVVVITSYTSMAAYKKAAAFDINGFLRKPVAPGALESAVVKALGGKISTKAMQTYKEEAQALYGESGQRKEPGFFAKLFGTDIPQKKPRQTKPAQKSASDRKTAKKQRPQVNRSA